MNMIDITKSKQLEHVVKIREKMAALGHVATGIAHEIRNPLSGINLYIDAMKERLEEHGGVEDIYEIACDAEKAARKIDDVIRRVLDFSRPSKPQLVAQDINGPIREAAKLSSVALRKSGIQLVLDLAEDMPKAFVDSQMIEQVMLNLINNAAEALTPHVVGKKIICITSDISDDHVLIDVSDSGPGVPEEIMDRIFEPFLTTKKNGSGIGLSLCQGVIARHGGKIEASTSNLGGAKIAIQIPIEKREFCR